MELYLPNTRSSSNLSVAYTKVFTLEITLGTLPLSLADLSMFFSPF